MEKRVWLLLALLNVQFFDAFSHGHHDVKDIFQAITSIDNGIQVETVAFPPAVNAPGLVKSLFLGGAGVRGLEIGGNFMKFTAIGIYIEDKAIPWLSVRFTGKCAEELGNSVQFFSDIVTGPFDKFTQVRFILPQTGKEYSEKVAGKCVAKWKSSGTFTHEGAIAIDKFLQVFKSESFCFGSSVFFTHEPCGSLTISFSKDGSVPKIGEVTIQNKLLSETVLELMIGQNGVSPAAKHSLALRLSGMFKVTEGDVSTADGNGNVPMTVPVGY